jgi:hypothetical protein
VALSWSDFDAFASLRVDIDSYDTAAELKTIVEGLRTRYPFLARWRCVGAQHYLGRQKALVTFANLPLTDEFAELRKDDDVWSAPDTFFNDEAKYPRSLHLSRRSQLTTGAKSRPRRDAPPRNRAVAPGSTGQRD